LLTRRRAFVPTTMSSAVQRPRASILVLGAAAAAPKRAHELRLRGHAAWIASSENADVAALPVVLIGADEAERRLFTRILAMLPYEPGNSAIISALPAVQPRSTM
jgi:hypothetical protein